MIQKPPGEFQVSVKKDRGNGQMIFKWICSFLKNTFYCTEHLLDLWCICGPNRLDLDPHSSVHRVDEYSVWGQSPVTLNEEIRQFSC